MHDVKHAKLVEVVSVRIFVPINIFPLKFINTKTKILNLQNIYILSTFLENNFTVYTLWSLTMTVKFYGSVHNVLGGRNIENNHCYTERLNGTSLASQIKVEEKSVTDQKQNISNCNASRRLRYSLVWWLLFYGG